jgi:hypothetical protein
MAADPDALRDLARQVAGGVQLGDFLLVLAHARAMGRADSGAAGDAPSVVVDALDLGFVLHRSACQDLAHPLGRDAVLDADRLQRGAGAARVGDSLVACEILRSGGTSSPTRRDISP